jgi:hypothetical protein
MTKNKRVELYSRLPEIYRIRDQGLPDNYLFDGGRVEAFQLRSYLEPVEDMFSAIHENIESLYHDLFIETCDEWVIPYIADLLGTSHLSGDQWTLRADVASTISLRRRKGTRGAIELLTFILTNWGVHAVEIFEKMVWNQHLNHQRPDEGGTPPYSLSTVLRAAPVRGGTVTLRDPSLLALLNTPFDPFAHVADVQPHELGQVRYNLPNLAIYLWRLKDYRLSVTQPRMEKITPGAGTGGAARVVRINVDPVPLNDISHPYVKPANTPGGRPVTLFNTNRYEIFDSKRPGTDSLNASAADPLISSTDQVPGPIPVARISDFEIADAYDASLGSTTPQPFETFAAGSFTAPHEYVAVETYDVAPPPINPDQLKISDVGLQLHIPNSAFPNAQWLHTKLPREWKIRGANLCAWETGLQPPVNNREIVIDPVTGRICIGLGFLANARTHARADAGANALLSDLLLTFTYGAVGEVGAHPISYPALPEAFDHNLTPEVIYREVNLREGKPLQQALEDALKAARTAVKADPQALGKVPIVIEITDSLTHPFNVAGLPGASPDRDRITEGGGLMSILLNAPLIIRAADGERPIVELARPLAFRPANVFSANTAEQKQFDAVTNALFVRLEGLYIARRANYASTLPVGSRPFLPLIARAALNRLEILSCTIDPGGFQYFNGTRAPLLPGLKLTEPYGFDSADEEREFKQTPEINIQRSITGAVWTDEGYELCLVDSIVESIPVPNLSFPIPGPVMQNFAITGATDPIGGYGGSTVIKNVTILGRTRTKTIEGSGGIFKDVLEVFDQQSGCLKYCYFADDSHIPPPQSALRNRLPQNFACVNGIDARLIFTSEFFGHPAYCQLSLECDPRILEQGTGSDQMGAFNFLLEAHKWRNLRIRFREFMPVGIRPILIPVT